MTNADNAGRMEGPAVDLTNCDREPIHVPGAVQPHGVLLAVEESDLRIVQASGNTDEFLDAAAGDLLGNSLALVLGQTQTAALQKALGQGDLRTHNPLKMQVGRAGNQRTINAVLHRHLGILFVELEPAGEPADAPMAGAGLWGLIACHNFSAKFVPYELRAACELVGQVVSVRMLTLEAREQTQYKAATNALQAQFLELLSNTRDLKAALVDGTPNLLNYVPAGGGALCAGEACYLLGKTPTVDQVMKLVRQLRRFASPVFTTDDLHSVFPEMAEYKDVASGVLSLSIAQKKNIYLLWFRPEQPQTVHWGGDPQKSVEQDAEMRLHPRRSFALWKEVVLYKSVPWTTTEVQSATELRSTLMGSLLNWSDPAATG
jgi:light-regulated signal transduction histidine kinase (bacteriophytochrome)